MIVERTLIAIATAAAVVAAVAVSVVAAFFALYAAVTPMVGPAWGAAIVAGAAALLAIIIALVAARKMEGDRHRSHAQQAAAGTTHADPGMVGIIMTLVKERPIVAAGAAVAVGVYALRNPSLISGIVKAVLETKTGGGPQR